MWPMGTTRDRLPEGIRHGEEHQAEVQDMLWSERSSLDLESQAEVRLQNCPCGALSEKQERAENVKAIFITYIFVISLLPFFLGAGIAFYLGGWKATIGILVWMFGVYLMLVGMYYIVRAWIRRKRSE